MKGKGILFGLLAGTVLGVLFAPDEGKKLREKLKQERKKGGSGLETAKRSFIDFGNDIWETLEDYTPEEMKEKVHETVNNMKEKAEDIKEKITDTVSGKVAEFQKKKLSGKRKKK